MEDLERALVLADVDREGVTGLGVLDRDRHAIVVLMPQQPHVDAVADSAVEFSQLIDEMGVHGHRLRDRERGLR